MNSYFLSFLLLFTIVSTSLIPAAHRSHNAEKITPAKIVFKSADGGQTWQDISQGLPENLQADSIRGSDFFANEKGLYLRFGNSRYHSIAGGKAPHWTKEVLTGGESGSSSGKPGKWNYVVNMKTTAGASVWSPVFEILTEPRLRSVFETAGGTLFITIDQGIFRSTDNGNTWNLVYPGGLAGHLAESNGVLLATIMRKIIRSTDNGKSWTMADSEDKAAWDIKPINGGFVAITGASESGTRRLSTSFDGGKTWKPLPFDLQHKAVIDSIWRTWNVRPGWQAYTTSILPIGENYFCTHPEGIFRSSDKGKTWKLLLPSIGNKAFHLIVSGNVIYAVRTRGGC